jgi:peptidyl-prolyl cis-trans isomerase C
MRPAIYNYSLFYCKVSKRCSLPSFFYKACWIVLFGILITACNRSTPTNGGSPVPPTGENPASTASASTPVESATPIATSEPLAATVNGKGIPLAEYQAELVQYQAARGAEPTPEEKTRVLQDLIDQELLAQGATEKGFTVDDALVQARIQQLGGEQALSDWISTNGYTQDGFRKALARSIAAAWMRDQIANALPKTAEQVHARQILLNTSEEANQVLAQLQAGGSFENLALEYDPLTAGDLGWFPRGILPDLQIEQAAFNLQPGEYSAVIQNQVGYHILQVIERNPQRILDPQALQVLQSRAVADWLELRRSQSTIEVLV